MRRGPRRSSIFGGLLLVVLGLLFLVHNLAPGLLHLAEWSRYWPALLILWGVALLWDRLAERQAVPSASSPQPPAQPSPRPMSAGSFFLILLIAAVFLFAYQQIHRGADWLAGFNPFANSYTFTTTLPAEPLGPATTVKLWTPRGNISVHPQPTQSMSVIVTKSVRAANQTDAQKVADATTVSIDQTPAGVQVNPRLGGAGENVSYDASLFPKTSLTAFSGHGDIHVTGIEGAVSLSASGSVVVWQTGSAVTIALRNGDVRVHASRGNVSLTGHGEQIDIGEIGGQVSIRGQFYGPIRIRRVTNGVNFSSRRTTLAVGASLGRLDLDSSHLLLSDSPGDVSLDTRDKDVQLENVQGSVRVSDRNGNVEARYSQPPSKNIDITSRSGDIDLVLPGDSSFVINAVANSGDISNDFTSPSLPLVRSSSNTTLDGTLGSDGPKITLNTTYGTIHIRRAAPSPPVPPPPPSAAASSVQK